MGRMFAFRGLTTAALLKHVHHAAGEAAKLPFRGLTTAALLKSAGATRSGLRDRGFPRSNHRGPFEVAYLMRWRSRAGRPFRGLTTAALLKFRRARTRRRGIFWRVSLPGFVAGRALLWRSCGPIGTVVAA